MQTAVERFLQYLRVERNASTLTIKSYREDLQALSEYLTDLHGVLPPPGQIGTVELRGYVAALHEAGYAKTTIARRLASLRSFFRFGQREGWAKSNPAKPLRNPRKSRALPHFLSSDDIDRLLGAPSAAEAMGLARSGNPGNALFGRVARQRVGRAQPVGFGLRRRHRARARQGSARADCADRLVRHPGARKTGSRRAAFRREKRAVPRGRYLSINSGAG